MRVEHGCTGRLPRIGSFQKWEGEFRTATFASTAAAFQNPFMEESTVAKKKKKAAKKKAAKKGTKKKGTKKKGTKKKAKRKKKKKTTKRA